MNKKTERILLGVVVAVLVLYGIYQVAYGTNESDYKWEKWYGFNDYQCLNPPPGTGHPCSPTSLYDQANMTYGCVESSYARCFPEGGITNQTAYRDGFVLHGVRQIQSLAISYHSLIYDLFRYGIRHTKFYFIYFS